MVGSFGDYLICTRVRNYPKCVWILLESDYASYFYSIYFVCFYWLWSRQKYYGSGGSWKSWKRWKTLVKQMFSRGKTFNHMSTCGHSDWTENTTGNVKNNHLWYWNSQYQRCSFFVFPVVFSVQSVQSEWAHVVILIERETLQGTYKMNIFDIGISNIKYVYFSCSL